MEIGTGTGVVIGATDDYFEPSRLYGLTAWYSADALTWQDSGFTAPAVNDGDPVGGWQDQSGNGNHLTQSINTQKPELKWAIANGLPVIRCTVSTNIQSLGVAISGLAQPVHVVAVQALRSATVGGVVWDGNTHGTLELYQGAGGGSYEVMSHLPGPQVTPDSNFHVVSVMFNGASSAIALDNSLLMTGNSGGDMPDGITIGAQPGNTNGSNIDFGELMLFDRVLLTEELTDLARYLGARWGIAIS